MECVAYWLIFRETQLYAITRPLGVKVIYGYYVMLGIVAQLAFGMDCDYRCELEVWGSKGTIIADRFFTAPAGFTPKYTIKKNQDIEQRNLPADDTFRKSLLYFKACIENENTRKESYISIVRQAELIEQIITLNNNNN